MDDGVGLPIQLVMEVERETIVAPVRPECEHQRQHGQCAQEEELRDATDRRRHARTLPGVAEWHR